MKTHQFKVNKDDNSRIASYESILDLFTLFSFVMIFAAFIYMTRFHQGYNQFASVIAQDAIVGSGSAQPLPDNVLLLVIYKEQTKDWLSFSDGLKKETGKFPIKIESIDMTLRKILSNISNEREIAISIYKKSEKPNYEIAFGIQRWLLSHGHSKFNILFAGNYEQ